MASKSGCEVSGPVATTRNSWPSKSSVVISSRYIVIFGCEAIMPVTSAANRSRSTANASPAGTPQLSNRVRRFVHRELGRRVDADLAELRLVQPDVVRQRLEELLGVQRGGDHAAVDLHVRTAGHDAPEVDHELARGVNDVRE